MRQGQSRALAGLILCGLVLVGCSEGGETPRLCSTQDDAVARATALGTAFAEAANKGRYDPDRLQSLSQRLMAARIEAERTEDWAAFCRTLDAIRADAGL